MNTETDRPCHGHRARKRFGQNFLRDQAVTDRLVRAINPRQSDHVVEIGPGQGALTHGLLAAGRLDLVELDFDLTPHLRRLFGHHPQVTVYEADALKVDFSQLLRDGGSEGADNKDERRLRVVGNLPYNISTPLIFHLLSHKNSMADMHFMLQKEVVDRLSAQPGQAGYGRLSVMVQYHCQAEGLFTVAPEAFVPQPRVQSAIVRLTPHRTLPFPCADEALFARIVKAAFATRRKTLSNSLKGLFTAQELKQLGIDPGIRAERLPVQSLVQLANYRASAVANST